MKTKKPRHAAKLPGLLRERIAEQCGAYPRRQGDANENDRPGSRLPRQSQQRGSPPRIDIIAVAGLYSPTKKPQQTNVTLPGLLRENQPVSLSAFRPGGVQRKRLGAYTVAEGCPIVDSESTGRDAQG
jgi:hypothetical protein